MNIDQLSNSRKTLYCYWISRRLFPLYADFYSEYEFGDVDVFLDSLKLVEHYLNTNEFEESEIRNMLNAIDQITPDTDEFGSLKGSFALNACCSLSDTLRFIIERNDQILTEIMTYIFDTIDFVIQEGEGYDTNDIGWESKVRNHPLMRRELVVQEQFMLLLKESNLSVGQLSYPDIIDINLIK